MKRRFQMIFITGALALGFQVLAAATASAHVINLTASAACVGPQAVISYTVSTVRPDGSIVDFHTNIQVTFNNTLVDTLDTSGDAVDSGSAAAPGGSSVAVAATAVGLWTDGFAGGQSDSETVAIPTDCGPPPAAGTGRFTGGGRQVEVGGVAKVTRGLTIHCDLLLSNNLEINWTGGNHFHMRDHLQTLECSDNPDIDQKPPRAPLDTLRGVGIGRFNGVDGYTVQFTLVDAGEPGRDDMMAIRIFETANPANVVLNVPLAFLNNGNLQAHYDQPHKNKP